MRRAAAALASLASVLCLLQLPATRGIDGSSAHTHALPVAYRSGNTGGGSQRSSYRFSSSAGAGQSIAGLEVHEVIEQASGGAVFVAPVGRGSGRTRRLADGRLAMVVEEVPLIPGYGTHIAYVYVGTPPQRVSVILDTGSHFTAFPCKGCKACGDHTDSYWDFDLSSTATLTKCPDCHGNFNCGANQRCVFSQSYSEGSSWSAFQVIDKLYTGLTTLQDTPPDDAALSIDFMFGCINSQTGLFNTQLADGIMGMSVSEFTLVWQLHQKGLLAQEKFSLCFDYGGGVMVLGGVEPLLRTAPMQYTPNLHDEGWFTVDLQDILIGGESINVDPAQYNRGKGVIVDSGTTDTYLPSACADGFRAQWQALTGMAYDNKPMKLSKAQFAALPTFTFVFAGGVRVDVKPEAYMDVAADHDGAGYTPRMYLDERDGAVLGANFMRDHDVVFDHANKRVGFAPANCDWSALQAAKTAAADAAAAAAAAAATAQPEPEPPAPSERPPPATMDTEPPSDPAPAETASPTKLPAGAQGVPATPAATQEPQATEAAATAEPQKGGADAASTEEPAAGGGEGGGATGTPEPTVEVTPEAIPEAQETPAPGLCETEADALVKPCNAKCPLGAESPSEQSGVEVWSQKFSLGSGEADANCPDLATETRPCTKQCSAGAPHPPPSQPPSTPAGEGDKGGDTCAPTAWSPCDNKCRQRRQWRAPERGEAAAGAAGAEAAACVPQARDCHTGAQCAVALMGLLVTGAARVRIAAAAAGGSGGGGSAWDARMSDALAAAIAAPLRLADGAQVQPGDVEVYEVIERGGRALHGDHEGGHGEGGVLFEAPFAVHVYPTVDEASAVALMKQLRDPAFGAGVQSRLSADADSAVPAGAVSRVETPAEDVSVLLAEDRSAYLVAGEHATGAAEGGSGGGSAKRAAPVAIAVVAALGVVAAAAVWRRRRRARAAAGGRARGTWGGTRGYQVVGPDGEELAGGEDEFELPHHISHIEEGSRNGGGGGYGKMSAVL